MAYMGRGGGGRREREKRATVNAKAAAIGEVLNVGGTAQEEEERT